MGLNDLPQLIKDEILGKGRDKDSYYDRSDNEIHITELLYCLTKSHYARLEPIEPELEQAFWLYRGNMLDEAFTSLFRKNQQRCTHKVSGIPCSIVGKYDFVDGDTLYDLKTTKSLFYILKEKTAKSEHIKQVQFYCYENSIPKAKVIYFDFGDCTIFDVPIDPDPLHLIMELEEKCRILYNSLSFYCDNCNKPIGHTFTEGMKCPHCKEEVWNPIHIPPKVDVEGKDWMCASVDWRSHEITKINCPYFDKCWTKEEFVKMKYPEPVVEKEEVPVIEVKSKGRKK